MSVAPINKNRVLECLKLAALQFEVWLTDKKYLIDRGLDDKTISDWQIGFSPDAWTNTIDYLLSNGFNIEEVIAAGLASKSESGRMYDRFRNRIMFPIKDVYGDVVAFTARINPNNKEVRAKYINSPQTVAYNKSEVLFGIDKAKDVIVKRDYSIVVEGQMDAIACHKHGFTNTVASSGTALTKEHLSLLKSFSNNIILSFDSDEAGIRATEHAIDESIKLGINVKVLTLPLGCNDPDQCLMGGSRDFKMSIINAKTVLNHYFDKITNGKESVDIIKKMLTMDMSDSWLDKLSKKIGVSEKVLKNLL